ncbi:MAG: hypothetical protein ACFCU5_20900 [Pleurocapsa sp.]
MSNRTPPPPITDYSHSLIGVNGKVIETYERTSKATEQAKIEVGLDPNLPIKAITGVAPLEEYIVFNTGAIAENGSYIISLDRIQPAVLLKSLYVDQPDQSSVTIKIIDPDDNQKFEWRRNLGQLPVEFPLLVIRNSDRIVITANDAINNAWITVKPVVLFDS